MRKIINISSFSRSRLAQDPVAGSYYGWHSQFGRVVASRLGYHVENWSIDAGVLRGTTYDREGLVYRIFSARIYLAPGREIAPSLLRQLRRELREHDVIIHLQDFHNWQAYAICLLLPRARIVAHYHGATRRPMDSLKQLRKILFAPLFLLEHLAESFSIRRMRHIFLANTKDRTLYERRKIPFSFCPMAPDLTFFVRTDRAAARRLIGAVPDELVILNVGGFTRTKNLGLMVAAFARVRAVRPAKLFLIGPTYQAGYRRAVEQLVAQLNLTAKVRIVEFLPKSRLNDYYNAADLLVVSSNQDEGGPTVVMEALALGLPVVSTPVGYSRDLVSRAQGLIRIAPPTPADLSAAIIDIATRPPARTLLKVWTWDDVIQVVRPVYEELFTS